MQAQPYCQWSASGGIRGPIPRGGSLQWISGYSSFSFPGASAVVVALCAFVASGCGPAGPAVQPVSGLVVMDGSPVGLATVILTPTTGGLSATGISGSDGRFRLTTAASGRPWPGAGEGSYTVTVTKVDTPVSPTLDPSDPKYAASVDVVAAPTTYVVPKDYGDPATSGLTATITKGKNDLKFELDSKFKAAK